MADEHEDNVREIAGNIVSGYLQNNQLPADDVPAFIRKVMAALRGGDGIEVVQPDPRPAVPIKRSVADKHVTCLVCGAQYKALKRHLRSEHGMGSEEYRAAFGLARDHPLVSRDYSRQRAEMAKRIGLGQKKAAKKKPAKKTAKKAAR